jgi:nucleotide-binding universal stress UspA family protein
MKTILVPTDFSKNADNALKYAIGLAHNNKKIILLHAFNIPHYSSDVLMEFLAEQLIATEQEAKKKLEALGQLLKFNGIKYELINQQGFAVDSIINTMKHRKTDLIVMGTKGASGLKEIFMGSNTAKTISRVSCPVIAVPAKASFNGLKKILFATSYNESDVMALKQLIEIARIFKSEIEVTHISGKHAPDEDQTTEQERDLWQFEDKIKQEIKYKHLSYKLLPGPDLEKELSNYLKKGSFNLLAVSTRYRNIMERIFGKSVTKKLVYHTKIPLWAFHYQQESILFI